MKLFSLLHGLAGSLIVGVSGVSLAVAEMAVAEMAVAEIVPDSTLPQPSQATPARGRTAITAGTRRGRNLFHSFRKFSVSTGEIASFQNIDASVANIFARVTGRTLSRIDGVIEVLQLDNRVSPANLFLVNPNGIIFGRNASLRIGGSFIATTADRIDFSDGTQFSAIRAQASPLLTVSVPVGLQFGNRPGPIINRSTAPWLDETGAPINDALGFPILGLVGGTNQTLALVGSDIIFPGGRILVEGGRIEIGSVAEDARVRLTPIVQGWDLTYPEVENFGDIRLVNGAIDGTGAVGATIQIQGRRVSLQNDSLLFTASASSIQPSGAIEIVAADSIVLEQLSRLSTETHGPGRAGTITLSTPRVNIRSGGQVGSTTMSEGRSGNVQINASESITVTGFAPAANASAEPELSLIYAQTEGQGTAGNLTLETDHLQVRSGGQISANTFSSGNAGNSLIRANTIELIGTALDDDGSPLFSADGLPLSSGLFVGADFDSSGNGGRLTIATERLRLQDGAILQATTYESGNAGEINIRATESIEVSGITERSRLPARIAGTSGGIREFSTSSSRRATGRGGDLNITTPRLTVEEGGIITVNSLNPSSNAAGAGTIRIRAERISLNNQGRLNAQTESGDEAGIQLTGVDLLTLRRNSDISTSAGLRSGGGDGGDIGVNADLILNAPAENSDINADAGNGDGGNIDINALGILGVAERSQRTFQSDITATSESGVDGEISISNPTFDPTQGIVELPSTVVDASQLIAQGCRAGNRAVAEELGEFVMTGRGGLPPSPSDLRSSTAVITDWATLPPAISQAATPDTAPSPSNLAQAAIATVAPQNPPRPVVEAQGWVVDPHGKVALVANAPTVTPHAPNWSIPHCISQASHQS